MAWFMPALIGAGLGLGTSLLTKKDPLKGALIGGALGGVGGQLIPAFQGAGEAAAASVGSEAAQAAGGNALMPYAPEMGAFNTFDFASGNPLTNPAAQIVGSTGEMAPNMGLINAMSTPDLSPMVTRAGQGISSGGLALRNSGEAMASPSFFDGMSDYMTPQNVLGLASTLDQQSNAPQLSTVGGGGGVSGGNANVGETVQQFLQRLGARAQSPARRQGLFY